MRKRLFVSYLRVSTARQGRSGLGLEAQRAAVLAYLNGGAWELLQEFVEVESGKRADRPQLAAALAACRIHGATLVIAKLDRLSRDAAFLLGLQNAGVKFVAADMPSANEMVVGIMAVVAQAERQTISDRTKAALAAAKAKGTKLGGFRGRAGTAEDCKRARAVRAASADRRAVDLRSILLTIEAEGFTSLNAIAGRLTNLGIPAPRGGSWGHSQVRALKQRMTRLENGG